MILHTLRASALASEISNVFTVAATALLPDAVNLDWMWFWRGLIVASLLLNLHFLRKVYGRVALVETHNTQIATITIAVEYLAQDAIDHGANRSGDRLILQLLEQVKKLQPPPERGA